MRENEVERWSEAENERVIDWFAERKPREVTKRYKWNTRRKRIWSCSERSMRSTYARSIPLKKRHSRPNNFRTPGKKPAIKVKHTIEHFRAVPFFLLICWILWPLCIFLGYFRFEIYFTMNNRDIQRMQWKILQWKKKLPGRRFVSHHLSTGWHYVFHPHLLEVFFNFFYSSFEGFFQFTRFFVVLDISYAKLCSLIRGNPVHRLIYSNSNLYTTFIYRLKPYTSVSEFSFRLLLLFQNQDSDKIKEEKRHTKMKMIVIWIFHYVRQK